MKFTVSATIFTVANTLQPDGKCRILALRGGGVHGSYEVGVLKAFIDGLHPDEIKYDYVSGVSVGAINASVLSLYPPGKEKEAVDELYGLYTEYLPQDYWEYWPYKLIAPFRKSSMVDNSKFVDMVNTKLADRPFVRKFSWQSVDI